MKTILIANRGEIAIRIAGAVQDLGLTAVAAYSEDEATALHTRMADRKAALPGKGARAYRDVDAVVRAARDAGAEAVHPGYGFLSENADFAEAVARAGLTFIGPAPDTLRRLGDKTRARALAQSLDVPVAEGLGAVATPADIAAFMADTGGPVVLKAAAGGGGRGMRVLRDPSDIDATLAAARAEAEAAFGVADVYAERFLERARHIEVQVIGDGTNAVHLWDRDCTLQRRHQKVIEIAPALDLPDGVRDRLLDAAIRMARSVGYRGLGTWEFLVAGAEIAFIEVNPRLQVEHTVTEQVTGVDLVQTQIRLFMGETLTSLGLTAPPAVRGVAVQARVNMERMTETGATRPAGGTLGVYQPPSGPGLRVDGCGEVGMAASPHYDSLLAKVIAWADDLPGALSRADRALGAFRVEGVETSIPQLRALVRRPETGRPEAHTRLIEQIAADLIAAAPGAPVNTGETSAPTPPPTETPKGAMTAPMQGLILSVEAEPGDILPKGATLFVMEAMKMRHPLTLEAPMRLDRLSVTPGDTVQAGDTLAILSPAKGQEAASAETEVDLDRIRPDLAELRDRKALLTDAARPEAVAKRRKLGKQTARENVAQLTDPGSFIEYGDFAVAAQRFRRSLDDLRRNTPADGMIAGFGAVNADLFGPETARTAVLAYDYTVLAGTQGMMNHKKKDRMFDVIERQRTPLVIFCEGGGGRPGDVDASDIAIAGLDILTFSHHARLSGLVPMVGIASGRLFAGNAALLGCCDVVIATQDSCIGMGGPAMIEGGGLGRFRPEQVGPVADQHPNGVIDVLVRDEAEAIETAKRYLAYFQGPVPEFVAPDPRLARHAVPEDRLTAYDVHGVIEALVDVGSFLELRAPFAPGMVTGLARIGGRTVGLIANNPTHMAGAIVSDGADKAARFMQLCDAHDIPILTLIDTPGMMVGPEVERTALVRHCSRLFVTGANIDTPLMSIILRKGYGLGAQAMAGGSFRTPLFIAAWPTGEIGAMGLEGAVTLGYRKELEAEPDPAARQALFERMVAQSYERGKAINAASVLEFDTVIDPGDTRAWVLATLEAAPKPARTGKKRPFVDTW